MSDVRRCDLCGDDFNETRPRRGLTTRHYDLAHCVGKLAERVEKIEEQRGERVRKNDDER